MPCFNIFIFLIYTLITVFITFLVIKLGENWAISWFTLLVTLSNLFSLKQITLFGLHITASDPLIISWIIGLNLSREFFSKEKSQEIANIVIVISLGFSLLSRLHLALQPNIFDWSDRHFQVVLSPSTRIVLSSIVVFFFLQKLDRFFFYFLKNTLKKSSFALRSVLSSIIFQLLYAVFFSYIAFYGIVNTVWHLALINFLTKLIMLISLAPLTHFMSKIVMRKKT